MADTTGTLAAAAVKRPAETTDWGDKATSPTCQIPLLSESLTSGVILDHEEAIENKAARTDADVVGVDAQGSFATDLWYDGLEYLFHAALGFECPSVYTGTYPAGSGGSPASAGSGVYVHLFEPDNTLEREAWLSGERDAASGSGTDGTYWTAADKKVRAVDVMIDKKVPTGGVHNFINCMVRSMTLKAGLDGVTLEWDVVGYNHDTDTYNRGSWDFPGTRARATFPQMTVGMDAAGASEPAEIAVQEITMKLENPMEVQRASGTSSEYIIEPCRNGMRKVTGTITLARYNSDDFPDWMDDETDLQLAIDFQHGTAISGSDYPEFRFLMPLVRITKADFPVPGPGIITGSIEYEAFIPSATPAWITTHAGGIDIIKAQELYLFIQNTMKWAWSRDRQSGLTLP